MSLPHSFRGQSLSSASHSRGGQLGSKKKFFLAPVEYGIKPCPLQWKHGAPTTGPPEEFPRFHLLKVGRSQNSWIYFETIAIIGNDRAEEPKKIVRQRHRLSTAEDINPFRTRERKEEVGLSRAQEPGPSSRNWAFRGSAASNLCSHWQRCFPKQQGDKCSGFFLPQPSNLAPVPARLAEATRKQSEREPGNRFPCGTKVSREGPG